MEMEFHEHEGDVPDSMRGVPGSAYRLMTDDIVEAKTPILIVKTEFGPFNLVGVFGDRRMMVTFSPHPSGALAVAVRSFVDDEFAPHSVQRVLDTMTTLAI